MRHAKTVSSFPGLPRDLLCTSGAEILFYRFFSFPRFPFPFSFPSPFPRHLFFFFLHSRVVAAFVSYHLDGMFTLGILERGETS